MKTKRFSNCSGPGYRSYKMLPYRYEGRYRRQDGRVFKVYSSAVNDLSAIARLEPLDGTKAEFAYDPGHHLRRLIERARRKGRIHSHWAFKPKKGKK